MRTKIISHSSCWLFLLALSVFFQRYFLKVTISVKPFMIVSCIFLGIYIFNERMNYFKNTFKKYEITFYIFAIFAVFSGLFSKYPEHALRIGLGWILVFILYSAVRILAQSMKFEKLENIILWTGIIAIIFSFFTYFLGDGIFLAEGCAYGRFNGTLRDPNIFVLYYTFAWGFSLWKIEKSIWHKILFVLTTTAFLLSLSRGGILGIICLGIGILVFKRNQKFILKTGFYVFIAILLTLGIWYLRGYEIKNILLTRSSIGDGSGRLEIWLHGFTYFKENWLRGIGIFNFRDYSAVLNGLNIYMHNTFLEIVVENGVIGAALFAIFLFYFFKDKAKTEASFIFKLIICAQLIQIFFLSQIISETVFLSFALYKACNYIPQSEDIV